jgi:hypothetical protein
MNFKSWFVELSDPYLTQFVQDIKNRILKSIQIGDGFISVRFPVDTAMRLVAHTVYEGIGQEDPYGKGGLAYKAVAGDLPNWDQKNVDQFKSGMQKNIQVIAKEMGLLFELDIFVYLTDYKQLTSVGNKDSFWAYSQKDSIVKSIESKVGKLLARQIIVFLEIHAKDTAEKIYAVSKQKLPCEPEEVEFRGGQTAMHADPSDLKIGCKGKLLGYSLKFTSETKIHVASISHEQVYSLLGGENPEGFNKEVERLSPGFKSLKAFVIEELGSLTKNFDPDKFTNLLNYLISGQSKTIPAISHYIRRKGNVGFSASLLKDFSVSKDGFKLIPKQGSEVTSMNTNSYMKLTYRTENGTVHGTSIFFEPTVERVNVKMTNLS